MGKLQTAWFKNSRDAEQKEAFEKSVFAASVPLTRLREILLDDLERLHAPKEADYNNPSWAYAQAHQNGKVEMINKLLLLLEPIK